ncbi:site-specific DNA-methyltransferase [soil metagenome]
MLPSLLPEFAGKVDLIYIDPPFATGGDFSYTASIPDDPNTEGDQSATFVKQPSVIEQKAYRDTWGRGLDGYLEWFYGTVTLLRELLSESGSIYVHLNQEMQPFARGVMDEVFGPSNHLNDVIWHFENKPKFSFSKVLPRDWEILLVYAKSNGAHKFEHQLVPVKAVQEQAVVAWDPVAKKRVAKRDEEGNIIYETRTEKLMGSVWTIPIVHPVGHERTGYPTQKPEVLLERLLRISSDEGDLVLDCFAGSGTTAAVAEKLGRRWITCDLGRFAIHTTRKRLLGIPNVKPFVVQNLGKYERQAWQAAEFNGNAEARMRDYREFILQLYRAQPISGYVWLHGAKHGRMVHVGGVDAPVSTGDVTQIATEFRRAIGTGASAPTQSSVDVLGWDFAFELNEVAKQQAALAGIDVRFIRIPREVLEKKAVEQGDIRFFELAALSVDVKQNGKGVTLELKDFVIPTDEVPEDVQRAITHWEQWIEYWAVEWDNRGDAFHNEWQAYRTRKDKTLQKRIAHSYTEPGSYNIVVQVIDILGNETTKTLQIEVR